MPHPHHFTPTKEIPGLVWTDAENLTTTGFDPWTVQSIARALPTTLSELTIWYYNLK
jgi:hypothetical protein